MSRLSIAIPWSGSCSGSVASFEQTLVSVLQNRPEDCEILVIHREPYEDPYNIGQEVQLIQASQAKTVSELLNVGFAAADTEWVHILSCGCEVEEGWLDDARGYFNHPQTAVVAPLVLSGGRLFSAGLGWGWGGGCRRLAAGRRWRTGRSGRHRIQAAGMEAGFYRRQAVLDAGGFDPTLGDGLSSFDLALTLAELDFRSELAAGSRVLLTNPPPVLPPGFASGRQAERLFWRHAGSKRAAALTAAVALHTLAVTAVTLPRLACRSGWLEVAGRCVGMLEFGTRSRQVRRVRRAEEALQRGPERTQFPLHARSPSRGTTPHSPLAGDKMDAETDPPAGPTRPLNQPSPRRAA